MPVHLRPVEPNPTEPPRILLARPSRYPQELQERAVRMVIESRADYETEYAAIRSVAAKLGVTSPESLRKWLRRAEIDGGLRPGKTSEEIAEIKALRERAHPVGDRGAVIRWPYDAVGRVPRSAT